MASFKKRGMAQQALDTLHDGGFPVDIVKVNVNGTRWYRLVVAGFGDPTEARVLARKAGALVGVNDAWIYR